MPSKMFIMAGVFMLLSSGIFVGSSGAQSPGYALRDPAVTGVPESAEPDIEIPSGPAIDRCLLLGGELISPNASLSVTWMNESALDNRTCISLIGKWTRTIGASKVYDQNGCLTSRSKPLTVTTYFRQRFSAIYEFNDQNGDGVANVVRNGQPIEAGRVLAREAVYKAVDLRTGWKRTDTSNGTMLENGHEAKTFEFTLTATNLSYIVIGDPAKVNRSAGDGILNEASFTFHMKGWFEPDTLDVPLFNITVDRSGAAPKANATKAGTMGFEDHTMKVKSKEDHSITGWDFDPSNTNPGLVLETDFTYGSFVPAGAPDWLTGGLMESQLGGAGSIGYKAEGAATETVVDGGTGTLMDADGPLNQSDSVRELGPQSRIGFRDNWQEAGWFSWPEATRVWPNESAGPAAGTSAFQVQGARRFTMDLKDRADEKLVGVFLLGGFSYTGGPFYKVRHDPENKMDFCFIAIPNKDNNPPVAEAVVPNGEFSYTESVTLNGSGSMDPDQDPLTHIWREGSAILGTGPVLTRNFAIGRHNVALTVDDGGSGSSANVSFDVVNRPPTAVIKTLTKTSFSPKENVGLDGSLSADHENADLAYEWKEGAKTLGTGPRLSRQFSEGKHTVTLVVTDEKGRSSEASATFSVRQQTPGFGASVLAAALGIAAVKPSLKSVSSLRHRRRQRRPPGPRPEGRPSAAPTLQGRRPNRHLQWRAVSWRSP